MENTTKLELLFPVTVNGTVYQSLNIRRSKVKDRLAVSKLNLSDEEREIRLLSNLCEVHLKFCKSWMRKTIRLCSALIWIFSNKGRPPRSRNNPLTHYPLVFVRDFGLGRGRFCRLV